MRLTSYQKFLLYLLGFGLFVGILAILVSL